MVKELLNARQLADQLKKMAEGLMKLIDDPEQTAIIGIRTRGALLAQRLHKILALEKEWTIPVGILDITLYRDDLSQLASHPLVHKTHLDFDLTDRTVLLIDDVLYTGRTIRCAIDELIDFGRPRAIRLAVLVDRNGREYPIQADYAALKVVTEPDETVKVSLIEVDGEEKVTLLTPAAPPPPPPDLI